MSRSNAPKPSVPSDSPKTPFTLSGIQLVVLSLLGIVFVWSYWPTVFSSQSTVGLIESWWTVDDYSHGFLVIPIAILFLWLRRESRPAITPGLHPAGLIMIAAAAAVRWLGASYFIEACDGWSMILWLTGLVWIVGGWPLVRWALPSLGFLVFMVPLPYRLETAMSLPLQKIAAGASSFILQSLGLAAMREGTTIVLGQEHLDVNRACAGLRMFTGVVALAYVFAVLSRRPWWDKVALFVGAFPIAIIANIVRITTTALLYQVTENISIRQKIHDNAGLFTILVAAIFMGLFSMYLKRLIVASEVMTSRQLVGSAER